MKSLSLPCLCLLACLSSFGAFAQAGPATEQVRVHYLNPGKFTEATRSSGMNPRDVNAYLAPLKAHVEQRAERILAPGQRLDINIVDVDRAGEFERWRRPQFNRVRIIKDIYPPRIDLDFTLYGANGKVLRKGFRSLRDPFFRSRASIRSQDPLRYEKSLIDRWLRGGTDKL